MQGMDTEVVGTLMAHGDQGTVMSLTLGGCGLLADPLAQLVCQPQLHADEGLPTFLGQLAPRFGPRQHVTHTALGQSQHLGTTQVSPTKGGLHSPQGWETACPPPPCQGRGSRMPPTATRCPTACLDPLSPAMGANGGSPRDTQWGGRLILKGGLLRGLGIFGGKCH